MRRQGWYTCNSTIMGLLTSPHKMHPSKNFWTHSCATFYPLEHRKHSHNLEGDRYPPMPAWAPIFFLKPYLLDFGGVPILPKTIFLLYSGTGSETWYSQSAELPRRRSSLWLQRCIHIYSLTLIIWLLPMLIKNYLSLFLFIPSYLSLSLNRF